MLPLASEAAGEAAAASWWWCWARRWREARRWRLAYSRDRSQSPTSAPLALMRCMRFGPLRTGAGVPFRGARGEAGTGANCRPCLGSEGGGWWAENGSFANLSRTACVNTNRKLGSMLQWELNPNSSCCLKIFSDSEPN